MFAKLNKLSNWQAAIIIAIVGFAVFFTGLSSAFRGDDDLQIVSNPVVHSITHIILFFEGGTFYNGRGIAPLTGIYFRPLMTTTFSLLYTLFGPHPIYFHLFQLLICIGSAIVIYLFFRCSFKPALALFLSLVFLVHPIDSQVVYALPSMQDALFFFFGILAMYILFKYGSTRSLLFVVVFLFLSLLSKETGILFVVMALLYLFWFNRARLFPLAGMVVLPIVAWLVLKIHAVGLNPNPNNAPIDRLNLAGRLLTAPSIIQFYMSKLLFPWKLATGYYWTYARFSISHVLLPLIIDLTAVAVVIYVAIIIRRRAARARYLSFIFFAVWTAIGLGLLIQIVPLDMTACETWFYFPMVGVLGMIGVALMALPVRSVPKWTLPLLGILIVGILGFRSAARGLDWRSEYALLYKNIAASREDFGSYEALSETFFQHHNYNNAELYAQKAVNIYPDSINYDTLGKAQLLLGNYSGAYSAFTNGLNYGNYYALVDDMSVATAYYGDPTTNRQFLLQAVKLYPHDVHPWFYLALLDYEQNNIPEAKMAISRAREYGASYSSVDFAYQRIINDLPLKVVAR